MCTSSALVYSSCTRGVQENGSICLFVLQTISAVWGTTKQIAPFSCTPRVQEVHTKAEVVHLTPGLLGLGVLFNCHA